MKPIKCDKCCIGFEYSMDDGVYLVDEGFEGELDEGFEFCPQCGFELPEYVAPKREQRKPTEKTFFYSSCINPCLMKCLNPRFYLTC